ncbi:DNA polymerase I domain protein [Erythrobacter sp. NAP1]|uniref:DNA polymerase n=1 Tax=Erythrobacter sp. NAP1 TaxID=237727 RepID=UPI0000686E4E|nr:DNA polymerase [Erythrobacter sp. NAP1]EAQ29839.1 DNA polymerase I domain protein [Erythrobacter sp. NAP1]
MIDLVSRLLIFIKDFTGRKHDSFYWFQDGNLEETDAASVAEFQGIVVCHDFWLIRDALYDSTGTLPALIVDLDELRISVSGCPEDRIAREKRDITSHLEKYGIEREDRDLYQKMFNKSIPFDEGIAVKAATAIAAMYLDLCAKAYAESEFERFFNVEVPAYRLLQLSMSAGISIDTSGLSEKRGQAEHDYFVFLKDYSANHDMPIETPSRRRIKAKLLQEGFELDGVSVDYILEFVPHDRDFGDDTLTLLALDAARKVLGSLTLSTNTTRPLVDVFGSRTSRVQIRSPNLQNIPKKYRSIINSRDDAQLCYVDFDQFEVGIMAALSGDEMLKELYAAGDMYELFATTQLGLVDNRKAAKQLFLSYAYGMSRKALVDAAVSLGVERQKAKKAFRQFRGYEDWKRTVWTEFQKAGRVSSILGNHFRREGQGQLTGKEQRSAVSQVVQGTASLIFKRALISVASLEDLRVALPMHDALLFEHRSDETPAKVVEVFESVMTVSLNSEVSGKASISEFSD